MRDIFNRSQTKKVDMKVRGSVSSFLVPEELFLELRERWGGKSVNFILKELLWKYRQYIAFGFIPKSGKVKLVYQDEGQNLIPLKFRPSDYLWAEFGIIAYGLGVTRCWLFSYLLKLEFSLAGEFFDLPEMREGYATFQNYSPKKIWQFSFKKEFFNRILHFKV